MRLLVLLCISVVCAKEQEWSYRLANAERFAVEPLAGMRDVEDPGPQPKKRCFDYTGGKRQMNNKRQIKKVCVPSFLIIGFGRCGTTSLARYLMNHPRLSFGTRKEHFYFVRPEFCDLQHGPNNGTMCTAQAYAEQFPVRHDAPRKDVFFDATPMLGGDMGVAASDRQMAWLRTRLPHLKFLVLVKSPADRFMSNPMASNKLSRLQDSMESGGPAVMPQKLEQLLKENCYIDRLGSWLRHFDPDRFLLIKSEDLRVPHQRQAVLDDVHGFLGVEPHVYAQEHLDAMGNYHKATNKTVLPKTRTLINCLPNLHRCERRLETAIGKPALQWCAEAREVDPETPDIVISSQRPMGPPTLKADDTMARFDHFTDQRIFRRRPRSQRRPGGVMPGGRRRQQPPV